MAKTAIRRIRKSINDASSQAPSGNQKPLPSAQKPSVIEEGLAQVTFDARHANDIDVISSSEGVYSDLGGFIFKGVFEYRIPHGNRFILRGFKYSFKTIYVNAISVETSIFVNNKIIDPLQSISDLQIVDDLLPAYFIFEADDVLKIETVINLGGVQPLDERGYSAMVYGNLINIVNVPLNRAAFKV